MLQQAIRFLLRTILFLLATPLIIIFCIFLLRGCNPWSILYGLEPARIGPKTSKALPKVSITPGGTHFLLVPFYENNSFALHIKLPDEYVLGPKEQSKAIVSYSFSTKMNYPDMSGIANPKNAYLRDCLGYCNGYVSTYIKAVAPKHNGEVLFLKRLYRDRDSNKPYIVYKPLPAIYGFDEHFSFTYPKQNPPANIYEFFIKKLPTGEPEFIFECKPKNPSPACSVYFHVKKVPELLIWANFGYQLLPEWKPLLAAIDSRVSEWVVKKYDLQTKNPESLTK